MSPSGVQEAMSEGQLSIILYVFFYKATSDRKNAKSEYTIDSKRPLPDDNKSSFFFPTELLLLTKKMGIVVAPLQFPLEVLAVPGASPSSSDFKTSVLDMGLPCLGELLESVETPPPERRRRRLAGPIKPEKSTLACC